MKIRFLGALVAVLSTGSANAALVTITTSGTINNLYNFQGISDNDAFTATFTYDTDKSTAFDTSAGAAYYSAMISASVSVGSVNLTLTPKAQGSPATFKVNDATVGGQDSYSGEIDSADGTSLRFDFGGDPSTFSGLAMPTSSADYDKLILYRSFFLGGSVPGGDVRYALGDISSFSVTSTPDAVPEPASWALFMGGFGLTGAALRRRKTAVAFA